MHKSLGAVLLGLPLYGGIYILIYKYLYLYFSISLKIFHNLKFTLLYYFRTIYTHESQVDKQVQDATIKVLGKKRGRVQNACTYLLRVKKKIEINKILT